METLEQILKIHAAAYPLMGPQDAVKLVYQNEFGGGHLIRDEQSCLDYLRREFETVPKNSAVPLMEDIGNGLVRVNLAAIDEKSIRWSGWGRILSALPGCTGELWKAFRKS